MAVFLEVCVGKGYGGVVDLSDISLRDAVMPTRFDA